MGAGTKGFKLLGADRKTYESSTMGEFGGASRSRLYGRLDCPSALAALKKGGPYKDERVFFADEATAIAAGYRPCARCLPEKYAAWKKTSAKQTT